MANDIASGFAVGQAAGGRFSGLNPALQAILDRIKQQQDQKDKLGLLGAEGLIKGTLTPAGAKPGQDTVMSIPGIEGDLKTVPQMTGVYDPDTGQIKYSVPKNSKPIRTATNLSQDDINSAAQQLVDGTLAPSQLSNRTNQKQKILDAAKKLNPNFDAAQSDIDFSSGKSSQQQFQKNLSSLKSFHKDFELNADYLLKISPSFNRSKSPLLNRAIVTGATEIQGDPYATKVLQAINTVSNGYAKLQNPTLSGQALTDASRREAQDLLNKFQSDAQLRALLNPKDGSMRIDAQNRIDAADSTLKDMRGKKLGNNSQDNTDAEFERFKQLTGQV